MGDVLDELGLTKDDLRESLDPPRGACHRRTVSGIVSSDEILKESLYLCEDVDAAAGGHRAALLERRMRAAADAYLIEQQMTGARR